MSNFILQLLTWIHALAASTIGHALLMVVPVLVIFPMLFAVTTLLERKGLGRMQNRYGPNRAGPWGLLQPMADGIKALTKEDVVPAAADRWVHFCAPVLMVLSAFLVYAVVPVSRTWVVAPLRAGVLYFFAAGSLMEIAVFMAGWSSRSQYSLLGAMRALAQMISYEIPLVLSAVVAVMAAGSLSMVEIVRRQAGYTGVWPHWFVLTPWGLVGFALFLIAATAESNRSPFDLPEGESEIIAGYYIEYSGFKFAMFFLAEYLGMFAISAMGITLFLGGWSAPFAFLTWIPSWIWFFAKLLALIAGFIWIRGTLPRLRMDQLMRFAWEFLLPMTLCNLFVAGAWKFLPPGVLRWLGCALVLLAAYWLLGRRLEQRGGLARRTYRFAE